jgi:tetratricopeptide (TPR) repeat protein
LSKEKISLFISYSHEDRDIALQLYGGLSMNGFQVWIDEHELRIGDSLLERIASAVADIDYFIALVSPSSANSKWCQKELALAANGALNRQGQRLLPLRVDEAEMPPSLRDQLYLDVSRGDIDAAIRRIAKDIASYQAEEAALQEQTPSQRRALDEERIAYERVIASGNHEQMSTAAMQLATLLEGRGEKDAALEAYRLVADFADDPLYSVANLGVGIILREKGDLQEAIIAFQRVIDCAADASIVAIAAWSLGETFDMQGEDEKAIGAYEQAIGSEDLSSSAGASAKLGRLLWKKGDSAGARSAWAYAINAGDPIQASIAEWLMGEELWKSGDIEDAITAFEHVAISEHAILASMAYCQLGDLWREIGNLKRALAAYRSAFDSGNAEAASRGAFGMATIMRESGDFAAARDYYDRVIEFGDAINSSRARLAVGVLLGENGDLGGAKSYLEGATHSPDPQIASSAFGVLDMIRRGTFPPKE